MAIMRKAVKLKGVQAKELQMLNRFRLAFQVIFLSELVENISLQVKRQHHSFNFAIEDKDSSWPAS